MWAGLDIIPNAPTFLEGKKHHPETVRQLQKLGTQYEDIGGVVVISPSFYDPDVFPVNGADPLDEDWDGFTGITAADKNHWDGLPFLAESLQRSARRFGVPVGLRSGPIHHSIWSPLRWMFPRHIPMPVLPIGVSDLGPRTHYKFGLAIRDAVIDAPKPIAILVSSNLTHREDWSNTNKKKLPQKGAQFDEALLTGLRDGDWQAFDDLEDEVKDAARPDESHHLWALIRGLSEGLQAEVRHYSPELGAFGMALVHYEAEEGEAAA